MVNLYLRETKQYSVVCTMILCAGYQIQLFEDTQKTKDLLPLSGTYESITMEHILIYKF